MTLHRLLQILYAYRITVIMSIVAMLIAAIAALLVISPKYTGTASVLVNNQAMDQVAGNPLQAPMGEGYVATQVSIITSPRVARDVVTRLELDKNPQLVQLWKMSTGGVGDKIDWLSGLLLAKLKVAPSRASNVIDINYESTKPASSAQVANAFMDAYLDLISELKSGAASQSAQFFNGEMDKARAGLKAAKDNLAEAEKKSGMLAGDDKLDVENARLNDLSTQLALAQAQYAESTARYSSARNDSSVSPDVLQNAVIQQLKGDISRRESQLAELGKRLGDRHPQYIQGQEELNQLRSSLSSEISRVDRSLDTSNRIGAQKVGQLQASVDAQRKRILALSESRNKLALLQREVDSAQHAYDLVLQRASETSMQSRIAQTDVTQLSRAVAPVDPTFPKPKLFIGLGLVCGLFLGIAIALLREMLKPRIYSVDHFMALTGIPVFSVIPKNAFLPFGGFPKLGRARQAVVSGYNVLR